MLNRIHRFHGYGSVQHAYRRGQNVRGPLMSLRFGPRPGSGKPYRVAAVVSRKVHKSAVTRNRIRRRVYETVRRRAELIPPGHDLIFTVYSEQAASLEAAKLETLVADLLAKAASQAR